VIDHEGDTPVYEQVAADLRRRIEAGEWAPRRRLPSVTHLEQQYGVARQTVLQALAVLRDRGVVYTVRNRGSFVQLGSDRVTVLKPGPGARIVSRPATPAEVAELGLGDAAWVTLVEGPGGAVEVFPADRVEIRGPEA